VYYLNQAIAAAGGVLDEVVVFSAACTLMMDHGPAIWPGTSRLHLLDSDSIDCAWPGTMSGSDLIGPTYMKHSKVPTAQKDVPFALLTSPLGLYVRDYFIELSRIQRAPVMTSVAVLQVSCCISQRTSVPLL